MGFPQADWKDKLYEPDEHADKHEVENGDDSVDRHLNFRCAFRSVLTIYFIILNALDEDLDALLRWASKWTFR